jgi:hypothetical protein
MRLLPILALAAAAMASAQDSPKPVKAPPMIIDNPDGTFTVQKQPPKSANDTKAKTGLVIPPQVVVRSYRPGSTPSPLPSSEFSYHILSLRDSTLRAPGSKTFLA